MFQNHKCLKESSSLRLVFHTSINDTIFLHHSTQKQPLSLFSLSYPEYPEWEILENTDLRKAGGEKIYVSPSERRRPAPNLAGPCRPHSLPARPARHRWHLATSLWCHLFLNAQGFQRDAFLNSVTQCLDVAGTGLVVSLGATEGFQPTAVPDGSLLPLRFSRAKPLPTIGPGSAGQSGDEAVSRVLWEGFLEEVRRKPRKGA